MNNVLKLGKALNKVEQKSISGGWGNGCQTGYIYADCDPSSPPPTDPCVVCANLLLP